MERIIPSPRIEAIWCGIAGCDADAIGRDPVESDNVGSGTDRDSVERNVWEVLRTIYDPEIPVNIVELGLVYHCDVKTITEGKHSVDVTMTSDCAWLWNGASPAG